MKLLRISHQRFDSIERPKSLALLIFGHDLQHMLFAVKQGTGTPTHIGNPDLRNEGGYRGIDEVCQHGEQ